MKFLWSWEYSSIECLPCIHEALSSNSSAVETEHSELL